MQTCVISEHRYASEILLNYNYFTDFDVNETISVQNGLIVCQKNVMLLPVLIGFVFIIHLKFTLVVQWRVK